MSKLTALFRLTFIVLLAGAGLSACTDFDEGAADYDEGVAAFERGDFATALRKLQPLAEQGHADAQHDLGAMYINGQGVPQDDKAAAQWYRRAAEQGNVVAQSKLGIMYFQGKGVLQDYVHAHMWANIAASGIESMVVFRNLFEIEMTPSQIAKAQKLAQECIRKEYKNCEY